MHLTCGGIQGTAIDSLPPTCYYIPNFVSETEAEQILFQITRTPEKRWTLLAHRRLLSLPTTLTGAAKDTLIDSPLPGYLKIPILDRLQQVGLFKDSPHGAPNHCLVNEYHAGQGIMPHEDGSAYYPMTATVSLGSHTVLNIHRKTEDGEREVMPTWRILQEPGSLLVTSGEMYSETLHGIDSITVDKDLNENNIANWSMLDDRDRYKSGSRERETRVSLTYRDVIKVAKVGGALKFLGKK